jgi:hypothetical protein
MGYVGHDALGLTVALLLSYRSVCTSDLWVLLGHSRLGLWFDAVREKALPLCPALTRWCMQVLPWLLVGRRGEPSLLPDEYRGKP